MYPEETADTAKAQAYRQDALRSGIASGSGRQGYVGSIVNEGAVSKAPLTVALGQSLETALNTVERINELIGANHYRLFGCSAPSAPSPISSRDMPEPDGFEATMRAILGRLNERLGDAEMAASSLVNRL